MGGAERMVIGHTQVDEGHVLPRCGGRLLLADTIISKDGYPMCWSGVPMEAQEDDPCDGSRSYVEIIDGVAAAIRVSGEGTNLAVEKRPLPLMNSNAVSASDL